MSPHIFSTPDPDDTDLPVIEEIARLRGELSRYVSQQPRRWFGDLRRMSFARAVRGSNWIEGYRASLDDVLDTIEGEEPLDATAQTRAAVAGYRDALTYVLHLAEAETAIDESLLKALHFMMTKHDLRARPGQYRQGPVWVADENGEHVYDAPDPESVKPLVGRLIESLDDDKSVPVMFQAAMAHLSTTGPKSCATCGETSEPPSRQEPTTTLKTLPQHRLPRISD